MKKTAFLSILLCLCMVASLVLVPAPQAAATTNAITVKITENDTWIDEFSFTATKAGEYTFTVPAGLGVANADEWDNSPYSATVYVDFNLDKDGHVFTLTLAENQTVRFYASAATKNSEWTITWTYSAGPITGTIEATTTDNNGWFDVVTFTAPEDADYTFTVPAGLGAWEKNARDNLSGDPYVDFVTDNDGGTFTVTLKKGDSFQFYIGAKIKGDWIIAWTTAKQDGPQLDGPVAVLGENVIGVTHADMMNQAVEYYFVVEAAGNYTFTSDSLIVHIFQDEMKKGTGMAYLEPGIYKLVMSLTNVRVPGEYNLTITTDAVIGGNNVLVLGENTIEYGTEHIANGKDYTFEVTEAGTYRFEGLMVTVKDSTGMMAGRNEAILQPGTYTVSVYNDKMTAGTFTLTVRLMTEEQLEQEAIDNVIGLINAIGEVTAESQDAIQTARDFYNALSDESKAKVTNLDALVAAEEAFAALTNPGDEPGTDEPGTEEPSTPPTTQPTTPPTTQPNGGNEGDDNNGSPVVIIVIVVVVAVVVVAAILFSKKRKA